MPIASEQLLQIITFLVFIIILIYWSGWFSGLETALTKLDTVQLAGMFKRHEKNSNYIIALKKDMNRTLITILIGNNVVNILLSAITALVADAFFQQIGISIAIGLITFLIIIFGDITPKSNAIAHSQKIAQNRSRTLYYLTIVLRPIVTLFILISRWILILNGNHKTAKKVLITDESIKDLVSLGQAEGLIKPLEKNIIHQVFLFGDRKVIDIMVPMEKVTAFAENLTIEKALQIYKKHSFTRIPIVNKNGEITGILNMKNLIGKSHGKLTQFCRKPLIVSGNLDITTLLPMMRKKRRHLAVVRNQKHRHIGIVTLEDIIEELVGEIYDEFYEAKYGKPISKKRLIAKR